MEKQKKTKIKKVLKIVLLLLLVLFILFLVITVRKMVIYHKVAKQIEQYEKDITNYQVKLYLYQGDRIQTVDYLKRNGIVLANMKMEDGKEAVFYKNIQNKEGILRINREDEKVALVMSEDKMLVPSVGFGSFVGSNIWTNFIRAITTKSITIEECNGKECYLFDLYNGSRIWMDKDTALRVREINGPVMMQSAQSNISGVLDAEYQFYTVTEEMVQKPDLTGYEIEQMQ